MGQDPDSELQKALAEEKRKSLPDIMEMGDDIIQTLAYKGDDGKPVPIHRSNWGLLKSLRSFIYYKNYLGENDYLSINTEEFDTYRVTLYNPMNPHVPPIINQLTKGSNSSTSKTAYPSRTPAEEFKKTIKRDKSHYKALKQDKMWDDWRRSTMTTAKTHGCEDIFNARYTPKTDEEKALFKEKQQFIYSVFEECLQTDMGRH